MRISKNLILIPLLLLLNGCMVLSTQPYSNEYIETPAEIIGSWQLLKEPAALKDEPLDKGTVEPWLFSEERVLTRDRKNIPSRLETKYFRVGEKLYCDSLPDSPGSKEKPNQYWTFHVYPAHVISRIDLDGDNMVINLMSEEWLTQQVKSGKIKLPHIVGEDNMRLYSATPKQWQAVLQKYGDDPEAFPEDHRFVLRRVAQ